MISRRNFIHAICLSSVAGLVLNAGGQAFAQKSDQNGFFVLPDEALNDPVLSFTSTHFVPFINTDFEARAENSSRAEILRLHRVEDVERKGNLAQNIEGDCFSLVFVSPRRARLKADRFEFTHFSLGTFTLTISPLRDNPNRYEAIISHLRR